MATSKITISLYDRALFRAQRRPTRAVLRAQARMGRPHGRKSQKAAIRVARWDAAIAHDVARIMARSLRAAQARAGVDPKPRPLEVRVKEKAARRALRKRGTT